MVDFETRRKRVNNSRIFKGIDFYLKNRGRGNNSIWECFYEYSEI